MARSSSYSWMPSWLRKFLNLDDEMPGYSSTSYSPQSSYTPPARPALTYTPPAPAATAPAPSTTQSAPSYAPQAPTFTAQGSASYTPNYPAAAPSEAPTDRFAASSGPPASSGEDTASRPSAATPPPPPTAVGMAGTVQPDGTVNPSGYVAGGNGPGYVQPIGYGLRTYARGALPPQGLEQFTREFRATLTDVWNFYSYWTRFQTDELTRIGKEALDVVVDNLPGGSATSPSGSSVRRIKVNVSNGNDEKKPATTGAGDAAPTTAPAPPPAPTARFSATVTADDAAVPPGGRDPGADFAARMAATAAKDVEAQGKAAAQAADEAAKDVADKAKDLGDDAKGAG